MRAEMAEPGHHLEVAVGDALGDVRRERRADVGRRLAADDPHVGNDLSQPRERAGPCSAAVAASSLTVMPPPWAAE